MVKGLVRLQDVEELLPEELREPVVTELIKRKESRKRDRTPAPPPPEGGITLNQAGRRYDVSPKTIHRWAKARILPILLETANCVYVDEKALAVLVRKYKAFPGRGRRTVYNTLPH